MPSSNTAPGPLSNTALDAIVGRMARDLQESINDHCNRLGDLNRVRYGDLPFVNLYSQFMRLPARTIGHVLEDVVFNASEAHGLSYEQRRADGERDLRDEAGNVLDIEVKLSRGSSADPRQAVFSGLRFGTEKLFVLAAVPSQGFEPRNAKQLLEQLRFSLATTSELQMATDRSEGMSSISVIEGATSQYSFLLAADHCGDVYWMLQQLISSVEIPHEQ